MKVNYNAGTIEIDLHGLLGDVAPEKRVELIESLACDDAIIKHVADQIIDRCTENCCSGGSVCTVPADASKACPLDDAWRRVAKASGDVARHEIEKMERALALRDEEIARLHGELRKIATRLEMNGLNY